MTVLTLALILGSISVASAASGKVRLTDIDGNTNEEAIQVNYDLGIVEGTPEGAYEPDKAVNRAEFAALIARALKVPDSALATYTGTTFQDTSGYGWAVPYLAYCQQKGIMKGDGYGNAMPGRTISPNEAVTMILRAIGYTDNASVLVGQWPANYVALGQNHNLYEDVSSDVQMNKASAAQMIYNALTVQLVQVDANSLVTLLYDSDAAGLAKTLLTTYLNCYRDSSGADRYGKKIITYADAASSKINLIEKVGAYGILYRSNVDKEAVALTEVETVFLAGKFAYSTSTDYPNIGEVNTFNASDGTKYNLSNDAKAVVERIVAGAKSNTATTTDGAFHITYESFNNGNDSSSVRSYVTKYKSIYSEADYQNYLSTHHDSGGNPVKPDTNKPLLIVAARVSGVTVLDLHSVAVWDATVSGYGDTFLYESGQVDGKKFNGHDFPLDLNNERDDYGYVLAGVDSLEDLAVDNVVYLYKNDNKKIVRIDVGTETQSGVITNINTADAQRTVGGKVLDDALPYRHSTMSDMDLVNNEGTALLDLYGRTYAFRLGDASKGNYAVVSGSDNTGLGGVQYKLFDKTGNNTVYGVTKSSGIQNGDAAWGQLVKYTLAGGSLSKLGTATGYGSVKYDGSYGAVNKAGTILTVNTNASGDTESQLIDSGVLVYVYDGADGDYANSDYSVGSINDLLDNKLTYAFQYYVNPDTKRVAALLINEVDAGAQNLFVMINSITIGSDGVGGEIDVVGGLSFADGRNAAGKVWNYIDGSLNSLKVNNDINNNLVSLSGPTDTSPTVGRGRYPMMIKFRIGEDGVLRAAQRLDADALYANSTDTTGRSNNPTITGAAIYNFGATGEPWYTPGGGGTFSLQYGVNDFATFEADTVLYKVDGSVWTAMSPSVGNLKNDEGLGRYTFLKTDPDSKAYDVIIKIN
jgi:hypothetical protein